MLKVIPDHQGPRAWRILSTAHRAGRGPRVGAAPTQVLALHPGSLGVKVGVHLEGFFLLCPILASHCPPETWGSSEVRAVPSPPIHAPEAGIIVGNASHMPLAHLHLTQYHELPGAFDAPGPRPSVLCGP